MCTPHRSCCINSSEPLSPCQQYQVAELIKRALEQPKKDESIVVAKNPGANNNNLFNLGSTSGEAALVPVTNWGVVVGPNKDNFNATDGILTINETGWWEIEIVFNFNGLAVTSLDFPLDNAPLLQVTDVNGSAGNIVNFLAGYFNSIESLGNGSFLFGSTGQVIISSLTHLHKGQALQLIYNRPAGVEIDENVSVSVLYTSWSSRFISK